MRLSRYVTIKMHPSLFHLQQPSLVRKPWWKNSSNTIKYWNSQWKSFVRVCSCAYMYGIDDIFWSTFNVWIIFHFLLFFSHFDETFWTHIISIKWTNFLWFYATISEYFLWKFGFGGILWTNTSQSQRQTHRFALKWETIFPTK